MWGQDLAARGQMSPLLVYLAVRPNLQKLNVQFANCDGKSFRCVKRGKIATGWHFEKQKGPFMCEKEHLKIFTAPKNVPIIFSNQIDFVAQLTTSGLVSHSHILYVSCIVYITIYFNDCIWMVLKIDHVSSSYFLLFVPAYHGPLWHHKRLLFLQRFQRGAHTRMQFIFHSVLAGCHHHPTWSFRVANGTDQLVALQLRINQITDAHPATAGVSLWKTG